PAAHFSTELQHRIVSMVRKGASLLMIGGWESFHGFGGNWDGTPIGEILPVEISHEDDRMNFCHGAILAPPSDQAGFWHLPWETPPIIGGLNRFIPQRLVRDGSSNVASSNPSLQWEGLREMLPETKLVGASSPSPLPGPPHRGEGDFEQDPIVVDIQTHLKAFPMLPRRSIQPSSTSSSSSAASDSNRYGFHWEPANEEFPVLVTGRYGNGQVAAFASDVAPHWVGGFVDWGDRRVKAKAKDAAEIEVGSYYARFWQTLIESLTANS
ncbi:MAG: hypothetical protein FJ267_01740, partial [Planctomycetes bacterium]|nr:hypothetical protein [Planctomycetota bacterium]